MNKEQKLEIHKKSIQMVTKHMKIFSTSSITLKYKYNNEIPFFYFADWQIFVYY